jgi:arginine decarboxylase
MAAFLRTGGRLRRPRVETPERVPHSLAPDAITAPGIGRTGLTSLKIRVSSGAGAGPTQLAAFDAALQAAGVAGYNIVRLSSVIPPHAVVREVNGNEPLNGTQGDIAFCVYAAAYASTPGEQAWAGMAWATRVDGLGAGLFVEHTAASESTIRRDLNATLEAMSSNRGNAYRQAGEIVFSAICVDHPVCALVVATYGTAGWKTLIDPERPTS